MTPDPEYHEVTPPIPTPVARLLNGLWQQREELGLIADELLAIFRQHGLTPPLDEEHHV